MRVPIWHKICIECQSLQNEIINYSHSPFATAVRHWMNFGGWRSIFASLVFLVFVVIVSRLMLVHRWPFLFLVLSVCLFVWFKSQLGVFFSTCLWRGLWGISVELKPILSPKSILNQNFKEDLLGQSETKFYFVKWKSLNWYIGDEMS